MLWIILGSFAVAVLRLTVPGHNLSWPGCYEAFAHIWVGVLIGAAIWRPKTRIVALGLLIGITAGEAYMFINE